MHVVCVVRNLVGDLRVTTTDIAGEELLPAIPCQHVVDRLVLLISLLVEVLSHDKRLHHDLPGADEVSHRPPVLAGLIAVFVCI